MVTLTEIKGKKVKLTGAIIMLILVAVMAYFPMLHKNHMTTDELKERLKETAWERDSGDGEEARLFTPFGDLLIAEKSKDEKLTSKSCWSTYKVIDGSTINVTLMPGDEVIEHSKYKGKHTVKIVDDNTLMFDGKTYHKASYEKWQNLGYDDSAWEN
mgnify:FL=1